MQLFKAVNLYHVGIQYNLFSLFANNIIFISYIEHKGSGVEMLKPGAKRRRTT